MAGVHSSLLITRWEAVIPQVPVTASTWFTCVTDIVATIIWILLLSLSKREHCEYRHLSLLCASVLTEAM